MAKRTKQDKDSEKFKGKAMLGQKPKSEVILPLQKVKGKVVKGKGKVILPLEKVKGKVIKGKGKEQMVKVLKKWGSRSTKGLKRQKKEEINQKPWPRRPTRNP
jgi:hypothetical protein